jgi:hypothetical protein
VFIHAFNCRLDIWLNISSASVPTELDNPAVQEAEEWTDHLTRRRVPAKPVFSMELPPYAVFWGSPDPGI